MLKKSQQNPPEAPISRYFLKEPPPKTNLFYDTHLNSYTGFVLMSRNLMWLNNFPNLNSNPKQNSWNCRNMDRVWNKQTSENGM